MATIFKAVTSKGELEGTLEKCKNLCEEAREGIITAVLDKEHPALCPSVLPGFFNGFEFYYEWDSCGNDLSMAYLTREDLSLPLEEWLSAIKVADSCASCGEHEEYCCKDGIETMELIKYSFNRFRSKKGIAEISPEMPKMLRERYISGICLCPKCWHKQFA